MRLFGQAIANPTVNGSDEDFMARLPHRSTRIAIAAAMLALASMSAIPQSTPSAVAMPLARLGALRDGSPLLLQQMKWVKTYCTMQCADWVPCPFPNIQHPKPPPPGCPWHPPVFGQHWPQYCPEWKKVCTGPTPTHPRFGDWGRIDENHNRPAGPLPSGAPHPPHRGLLDRKPDLSIESAVPPRSHALGTVRSTPRLR